MSFARRFREVVKKQIRFQSTIAKLGPAYFTCNERQSNCTRPKAESRRGCPNCEFTVQYKYLIDDLDKTLRRMKYTTRRGMRLWPTKVLLRTLVEVASLAHSTKKLGKKWTVVTADLVGIYRDEVAKKRAIENFNMMQSSEKDQTGPMLTARD